MPANIVSASRRTDIPAFYMPWFMAQIEQGFFEVENPYNRRRSIIPAGIDAVDAIVFWSKDFGRFLDQGYGQQLARRGYHLFFNFTINSPHPILEPGMISLDQRLAQLRRLCRSFGPQSVQWRFDPVCHFTTPSGGVSDNLDQFATIAAEAASLGIRRCITSFVDLYRKVKRRMAAQSQLTLVDPEMNHKVAIITRMARILSGTKIALYLCCEKEVLAALPTGLGIKGAACIPARYLMDLFGLDITPRRDSGQRRAAGCGCNISKDIGSYRLHPCRHNCLYCYANA